MSDAAPFPALLAELHATGILAGEPGILLAALEPCREGHTLDQQIIERGWVSEHALLRFVAEREGLPFLESLAAEHGSGDVTSHFAIGYARQFSVVALTKADGVLRVATSQPLNATVLDDLARRTRLRIDVSVAPKAEVAALIDRAYAHTPTPIADVLATAEISTVELAGTEDLLDVASKAPIIKLVNNLLVRALKMRASDIHLHPREESIAVRFRIDGVLYDVAELPRQVLDPVVTRVKVLGKMDIAERRLPQDGRASYRLGSSEIDLRISIVPADCGERVVFRILDKGSRLYTLDELGVVPETLVPFRRLITSPNGIVLVTGPTGSGKTTTLYASLMELDTRELNVMTIEDPIEYHLPGITQVQVASKKGLSFSTGLRAFLRQDPDVMMVGEIRDLETARIAIQSAQTGHLVFSTLHTNDSAGALIRLLDIGIEPYLVASSVRCAMAQRLVRRICTGCREQWTPDPALIAEAGLATTTAWRGTGCDQCMGTGYWDRTGLYELMTVSGTIETLVTRRANATEIKQAALIDGLRTLRMDGLEKAMAGLTTLAEVLSATMPDLNPAIRAR